MSSVFLFMRSKSARLSPHLQSTLQISFWCNNPHDFIEQIDIHIYSTKQDWSFVLKHSMQNRDSYVQKSERELEKRDTEHIMTAHHRSRTAVDIWSNPTAPYRFKSYHTSVCLSENITLSRPAHKTATAGRHQSSTSNSSRCQMQKAILSKSSSEALYPHEVMGHINYSMRWHCEYKRDKGHLRACVG